MITPKTTWVATDYFNISDYNRITSNLNSAAALLGLPQVSFRSVTVSDWIYGAEDKYKIVSLFNTLSAAVGWEYTLNVSSLYWFDYAELNQLESICIYCQSVVITAVYGQGSVYGAGLIYGGGNI